MDNDSLEDFFRKATSHHNPEFNEGDWNRMERRLDDHFGKPPVARGWKLRNTVVPVLLLAALGVLTVLLLRPVTDSREVPAAKTIDTPKADAPIAEEVPEILPESQVADGISAQDDQPDKVEEQDETNTAAAKANGPAGKELAGTVRAVDSDPDASANRAKLQDTKITQSPVSTRIGKDDLPGPANPIPPSKIDPGFNRLQADPQKDLAAGMEKEAVISSGTERVKEDQVVDSALAVPTFDALVTPSNTEEEKGKERRSRVSGGWSVSVLAAPDFSMTASKGMTSPGDAAGLMVHYQAFERWGIAAGVLYNAKKYRGRGDEYHPPKGYWNALTNGVVPDRVDGNCIVIEVPVSVTFSIAETKRSRLFATAGLSSYRMGDEDYYYQFDNPNPGAVTGWSGSRPSSLWFGIGTISIGYDFKATRSLSFGVEPYYKMPFEGVGWAKVDLYSTGVLFAAHYHFFRKDKHPPPSKGP